MKGYKIIWGNKSYKTNISKILKLYWLGLNKILHMNFDIYFERGNTKIKNYNLKSAYLWNSKIFDNISDYINYFDYLFIKFDDFNNFKKFFRSNITNKNIKFIIFSSNNIKILDSDFKIVYKIKKNINLLHLECYIWNFLGAKNLWLADIESVYLSNNLCKEILKLWFSSFYKKYKSLNSFNFFIIWPSGWWKTTFVKSVSEIIDSNVYNDLNILKEVFKIDSSNVDEIDENEIIYFRDYYNNIKKWLIKNKYTKYNWDGFDILNPDIWDIIIVNTIINLPQTWINLIEFSRWFDKIHLEKNKYEKENIYIYFITLIKKYISNPIFIFIDCDLKERMNRNNIRKSQGLHYISEKTMNEVYFDSFSIPENNFLVYNWQDYNYYYINNNYNNELFLNEFNKIFSLEKFKILLWLKYVN